MGRAAYMFKSQTIFFDIKSYATGDTFWPFFFSQHPSLQLKHVDVKKQNVECTCIVFCIVLNVLCWEVGCGNFHEINMWHVHADLPSDWCFNIRTWGWPVSWDQWCQVTQSVLGNRMMLRDVVPGVELVLTGCKASASTPVLSLQFQIYLCLLLNTTSFSFAIKKI